MTTRCLVPVLLMGSLLFVASPAWSDKGKEKEGHMAELIKDAKVTIDQAVKFATAKVQGTVVEAQLEKKQGKTVWEVEVVGADGKVMELHIDAVSGDVVDTEEKEPHKHEKKDKH